MLKRSKRWGQAAAVCFAFGIAASCGDGGDESSGDGQDSGRDGSIMQPDASMSGDASTSADASRSDAAQPDAGDGGLDETLVPCSGAGGIDPAALNLEACPLCEDAVCVPVTLLNQAAGSDRSALFLDCADGASKCVPTSFVRTTGNFLLKTCTAFGSAEGRCVNRCVPQVSEQPGLEQDVCGANELCAPCYNPVDGTPTGACGIGCDEGPTEDPYRFPACCGTGGVCVPLDIVPDYATQALGQDTCASPDERCAPVAFTNPSYIPPACDSIGALEGRCIPTCIPQVASLEEYLPSSGCDTGAVCAPCFDPLSGAPTGACSIGGDMPSGDPVLFATCCSDLGTCVPESAVPAEYAGVLSADTCASGELCAPTDFIDPSFVPHDCDSILGAEGRCVPSCMAGNFGQYLPRDACAAGEGCAPCYNPIDGALTGACNVGSDAPVDDAIVFPTCCGGGGTCVPVELVPSQFTTLLAQDSCPDADSGTAFVCAPSEAVAGTAYPTCSVPETPSLNIPAQTGICMSACTIPTLASLSRQLDCPTGDVCIPCYTGDGQPFGPCDPSMLPAPTDGGTDSGP